MELVSSKFGEHRQGEGRAEEGRKGQGRGGQKREGQGRRGQEREGEGRALIRIFYNRFYKKPSAEILQFKHRGFSA